MSFNQPGIAGDALLYGLSITDITDSVKECSDGDLATRLLSNP